MSVTAPEQMHPVFMERFNAGDLTSLMELYAEDAVLMAPSGNIVAGKAAIREELQGFLALKGRMEMKTRYLLRAGDITLLSGEFELSGTGPDGTAVEMRGKTAEVLRLQPDGTWLYVADHPFGGQ